MNWLRKQFQAPEDREQNLALQQYLATGIAPMPVSMASRLSEVPLGRLAGQIANEEMPYAAKFPEIKRRLLDMAGLDLGVHPLPRFLQERGVGGVYIPPGQARLFKLFNKNMPDPRAHGLVAFPEGPSPFTVGHELGHALTGVGKAGLLPQVLSKARITLGPIGSVGAIVDSLRALMGTKSQNERERLLNQASLFGVGSAVPILADEYQASRQAIELLERLPKGIAEKFLTSAGKQNWLNMGMYGTRSLAPLILLPQALKYGLRWSRPNE